MRKGNGGPVVGLCPACVRKRLENGGIDLCAECREELAKIKNALERGELLRPSILCPRCKQQNNIGFVRAETAYAAESELPVRLLAVCEICGEVYEETDGRVGFPEGLAGIVR